MSRDAERAAASGSPRSRRRPARPSPRAGPRMRLPVSLSALNSAAITTTAVPCWSSWKTGMSSSSLEPVLDLEAARRGDVLEVDAAEAGRDLPAPPATISSVSCGVEADREGVHAAELLEQHRLALHHRHGRRGPDVAEAEHRRAVGDDRHVVCLDRVLEAPCRAGRGSPRRPAPRPACRPSRGRRAVCSGMLVVLLDLAAEVQSKGAVSRVQQLARRPRRRSPRAGTASAPGRAHRP